MSALVLIIASWFIAGFLGVFACWRVRSISREERD
jgi:hypothetical protein